MRYKHKGQEEGANRESTGRTYDYKAAIHESIESTGESQVNVLNNFSFSLECSLTGKDSELAVCSPLNYRLIKESKTSTQSLLQRILKYRQVTALVCSEICRRRRRRKPNPQRGVIFGSGATQKLKKSEPLPQCGGPAASMGAKFSMRAGGGKQPPPPDPPPKRSVQRGARE